ncbi:hypothetical protein E4U09_002071 [Claviceps aff. purpurea]|uniref:Uncharacterized protein n=1 Tax=Claviceps aff. purpurea TaxID=1967640 RepID=A0A9P7QI95_9HYPO|nr:hypothetical protein E4U09_002071 [Claviceps aff. purpurea]
MQSPCACIDCTSVSWSKLKISDDFRAHEETFTAKNHSFQRLETPLYPLSPSGSASSSSSSSRGWDTIELSERNFPNGCHWTLPSIDTRAINDQSCRLPGINELGLDYLPPFQSQSVRSSSPDGENGHINEKYTTEQGDFIIYAVHDLAMDWKQVEEEYAALFGTRPRRNRQGVQGWYYRSNYHIPVWDSDGRLIFDSENDPEPRQQSIKCRDAAKDKRKARLGLGLGQRYPERAIKYHWVSPQLKRKWQNWALKRQAQYDAKKERRRQCDIGQAAF